MKKIVLILLAILMVTTMALGFAACKSDCESGNHVWDEGTQTKAPNCTEPGKMVYKCTVCDHGERVVDIPVNDNHTPKDVSIAPTCVTDGTTAATQCQLCGATIAAGTKIPALGHDIAYAQFSADDVQHVKFCRRDGCGYSEMQDHVSVDLPTGGTKCSLCDKVLSGGTSCSHPNKTVSDISATCTTAAIKHWSCPDCGWQEDLTVGQPLGHDYTGAAWEPSTTAGKHVRTCTREGCGYKDSADHTPEVVKGTPATCTAAGSADGSKCSACNAVLVECAPINALGHSWEKAWNNNDVQHWHDCARCDATNGKENHDFGEDDHDLTCNVCDMPRPGENYVLTYTLDGEKVEQSYMRLADAIAFIAENQAVNNVVIDVNDTDKTLEGLGVVIPGGLTITINLHESTYIIASDPVGSAGTETNGFQMLAGSNITIKNGTITSEKGSGVKMLIQNYANLTLDGVTLDGRNLDESTAPNYTLSNNCGTVRIQNKSKIIAREENGVALDVWYNMGGRYPQGVDVSVGKTCTITGVIEYGSAQADADLKNKALLSLPAGTYDQLRFTSNVSACVETGITIDEKPLTAKWGEWQTVEGQDATCEHEGLAERFCELCGLRDTKVLPKTSHTMTTAEYVGGHQHQGVCTVCGNTEKADCTEENYACTVCKQVLFTTRPVNVSIDTSLQGYSDQQVVTEIKNGRLTVTLSEGTSAPKYYNTGSAVRLYAKGTMTISVPENSIITKITFTFDSKDDKNTVTADSGSFDGTVWTGSADSVVFTVDGTKGHRRFQTITVEYTFVECNHFYGEWEITRDETCTVDGLKVRECLYCGIEDSEDIPAHHNLGELEPEDKGSCLENGTNGHVAYYYCEDCDTYFEDEDAKHEIPEEELEIQWQHTFTRHDKVEPESEDKPGSKAYDECTVCHRNYDLDGNVITDLESWKVIPYVCQHEAEHVWRAADNGDHVLICSNCDKPLGEPHTPANGTWNEAGDKHTLSCGVEGCTLTIATHNADYAEEYTVATDGDHVQACGDANCTLVKADTKHTAELGDLVPTQDGSQHHKVCGHEGCNYATAAEDHGITIHYIENGKHGGTCVCGKKVEAACNSDGDDNKCTECGRIVGMATEKNISQEIKFTTASASVNGFTVEFGGSGQATAYNSGIRFYAGNKMTIKAPQGAVMTKIVFDVNGTGYDLQSSSTDGYDTKTRTWIGEATQVVFVNSNSSQARFTTIEITYNKLKPCYHEGENVLQHKTVAPATCESAGIKTDCYYCVDCDTYFTTDACTDKLSKANAVISATGHTYGELINKRSATCEFVEYKMDHYYCEVCETYFNSAKEKVTQADVIGTTADHTWEGWENNNDGTHSRICSFGVHLETVDCTLNLNDWAHDAETHWHECPTCGYEFDEDYDLHDEDGDNGKCSVCGYNPNAVNISVSVEGGAASLVTTNIPKQAEVGTAINFTVTVANGYRLVSVEDFWTETLIEDVDGTYTYTFTNESVDEGKVTVFITIIKQITVNLSAVENGTMTVTYGSDDNVTTVADGDKVDVGTTLTIAVTPGTGYQVNSVTVTGAAEPLTANNGKYTYLIETGISANSIKISATVEKEPEKSWKLVTNVNQLSDGDSIIIVAKASKVALSTTQNTNNRGQTTVTITDDEIKSLSDAVQRITLEIDNGNYKLLCANDENKVSYLYAAGGTGKNNYLKTTDAKTVLTAPISFTITIASNGNATIKCADSTVVRNTMRYNSQNTCFACYESGQNDIQIFKFC